jgi:hypothetical protein
MKTEWRSFYDRNSHEDFFFHQRDWKSVKSYWTHLLQTEDIPGLLKGDAKYGITRLDQYCYSDSTCNMKDPKEKRKSFALVLAYDGSQYVGYQQQKGCSLRTVEDDLDVAFHGQKFAASGRTDKDVSALSQVICFSTYNHNISPESLTSEMNSSEPFLSHRLAVLDCVRVPRKFHPIFSATWRRYVYLFPVNSGCYGEEKIDVDVTFINHCFERYVDFKGFSFFFLSLCMIELLGKLFLLMVLRIVKIGLMVMGYKTIVLCIVQLHLYFALRLSLRKKKQSRVKIFALN